MRHTRSTTIGKARRSNFLKLEIKFWHFQRHAHGTNFISKIT